MNHLTPEDLFEITLAALTSEADEQTTLTSQAEAVTEAIAKEIGLMPEQFVVPDIGTFEPIQLWIINPSGRRYAGPWRVRLVRDGGAVDWASEVDHEVLALANEEARSLAERAIKPRELTYKEACALGPEDFGGPAGPEPSMTAAETLDPREAVPGQSDPHFTAAGKRVVSTFDPNHAGVVVKREPEFGTALVKWDRGFTTVCHYHEIDPEILES